MDDQTLASLEAALQASPDNEDLRLVVIRARLERGEPQEALESAVTDGPRVLLEKARALLALERRAEGLEAYREALRRDVTLEDAALEAELGARDATPTARGAQGQAGGDGPRLRVIDGGERSDEIDSLLNPERPDERVAFDDVGGLEHVKKQVRRRVVTPFLKPSLFKRFGKRLGGGILLYGPPGCGKTLLARATAGECEASFFNVAISDVLDMWIGQSEQKLHALFEKARAEKPSVLFFDEVEALGGKRQYSRDSSLARLVSQFLAEMDGFHQRNDGVLVLGATNLPWAVDPAFVRPGRFDRFLFVPPPDRAARETILGLELRDRPVEERLDLATLARKTSGFSGADLKNLVETAADLAIEESLEAGRETPIGMRQLREALDEVRPTTLDWLTTARNHARYANESGRYDEVLDFLRKHGSA